MTPASPPIAPYGVKPGTKYCQSCGTPNDPNASYCVRCGSVSFGTGAAHSISRPLGVTVLAILQMLASLVTIFVGLTIGAIFPFIGGLFSLFVIGVGVITLLLAIALFSGRNWARILNMIFAVIDLFNFPIGTIIGIIFLIYFTRPGVVAYFRQPRA